MGFALPTGKKGLIVEYLLVLTACSLLWNFGMSLVGDYRVDDAYITFAFSKNLALGKGPIYGFDLRDEGYSNFLWMLLASLGEVLFKDPLSFTRALSHGFFALLLGSTWLAARRLAGAIPAALVALALSASSDFHRAIQSGLETVAFSAVIAAGLCHYSLESPSRRRLSLLWFSAAALLRIDGFVPFGFLVGLEGLRWLGCGRRESLASLAKWAGLAIAPVVLFWVWRANYYGLPFPLPYYAKASLGIDAQFRGADYLWNALRDTGLWLAGAFAIVALVKRPAPSWSLFLYVILTGAYVEHVGGDWMPMNRMVLPTYAPLMVLFAVGLREVSQLAQCRLKLGHATHLLGAGAALLVATHLSQWRLETPIEAGKVRTANGQSAHTHRLIEALPFINAIIRTPGEKLVTDYGGIYAYGTDASVIEMWGLANREIALRGNTDGINAIYGKTCVPCYKQFDPDYFHWVTPLLRAPNTIRSKRQLIGQVFQGRAFNRVLDFQERYVVGRVVRQETKQALFFLEKKRAGISLKTRQSGDLTIDYPFHGQNGRPQRAKRRSRREKASPPTTP